MGHIITMEIITNDFIMWDGGTDYSDNKAISLIWSKITILVCYFEKRWPGEGMNKKLTRR